MLKTLVQPFYNLVCSPHRWVLSPLSRAGYVQECSGTFRNVQECVGGFWGFWGSDMIMKGDLFELHLDKSQILLS